MRVHQQAAFVLLNRPYSESSWVVEVFSREYGRLALMAKGARRIKSRLKGVLLPFQPLLLSWTGKGEVPTLTSAEIDLGGFNIAEHELRGDALICGFYCNELIVNLLHRHDPHPKLFDHYLSTILVLGEGDTVHGNTDLRKADWLAHQLREFEQIVIRETGYEVNFKFEADGKTSIAEHKYYRFQQGQGFVQAGIDSPNAVSGRVIRSITMEPHPYAAEAGSGDQMSGGKMLMRDILNQTLGYKKVVSRDLFFPRATTVNSNPVSID